MFNSQPISESLSRIVKTISIIVGISVGSGFLLSCIKLKQILEELKSISIQFFTYAFFFKKRKNCGSNPRRITKNVNLCSYGGFAHRVESRFAQVDFHA